MPDGALHQEDDPRGLLIFEVSGGGYALPVISVVEILPLMEPAAVPGWPEYGLGIFELRGEPVPLMDVRAALGHRARPPSPSQLVLVIEALGRRCGVVVDAVHGVASREVRAYEGIAPSEILPRSELSDGVSGSEDGTVIVLSADGLLRKLQLPPALPQSAEKPG
jgi:purine-binding chemotaxis protein CheW